MEEGVIKGGRIMEAMREYPLELFRAREDSAGVSNGSDNEFLVYIFPTLSIFTNIF